MVLPGDSPVVPAAFHCTEAEQGSSSSAQSQGDHSTCLSLSPVVVCSLRARVLCVPPLWSLFLTP